MLNDFFPNLVTLGFAQAIFAFLMALLVVWIANRQGIHFEKEDFLHKLEEEIQSLTKPGKTMGIEEAVLNYFEEKAFAKI